MAHGNASDLAFLLLLIGAIQTWVAPDLLFPPAADFADVSALIKFSGGLAFALGMAFSGVKWNPINGKMGGFGGFCAIANAVVLGARTGHIFYYVFGAALLVGALHIFAFPSNPLVPKGPKNKNNHGNLSDLAALLMFAGSMVCIFYPAAFFEDLGPLKASFAASEHQAEIEGLLSYCGGLILTLGMILSGVKWNPINGKMAGIGCFVCVGLSFFLGQGSFFYFMAAVLLLAGVHIFAFPSNPLPDKP